MRAAIRIGILGLLGLSAAAVFVAEGALHIRQREAPATGAAAGIAAPNHATWREVRVNARDGVGLDAWLFTPRSPNGAAVIALHGVGDTRVGMLGHADFLLRAGYTVLTPDCRGHGASGGDVITYGVREAGDVRVWADWLARLPGIDRVYGVGQSMGASILLESLGIETRFRAVAADCPFATFREIAGDRLAQQGAIGALASWPLVNLGFVYARARYGVNLWDASPSEAVRRTRVPVLLIHGTGDTNIVPRHSRELHALNPAATELWEVAGAGHIASLGTAREEYVRRVTRWFDGHR
jgi:dipeptidyl aminopeptidase/acylaminoacyl peptidase